jgi:outer membrane lipoprotein SlyB
LNRFFAALASLAPMVLPLGGCAPSYSPDTYATNAAQQANKVEEGVIAGVRPVKISAQGTVGGVTGAAVGGAAGSQVGVGATSVFTTIGGSLVGGIAGVATEHVIGDTNGFEYIVRKSNGDMIGVAQKDPKPLHLGQKVLVIAGPQARIVPDYTVPFQGTAKADKPPADGPPAVPPQPLTVFRPVSPPPAIVAAPDAPSAPPAAKP